MDYFSSEKRSFENLIREIFFPPPPKLGAKSPPMISINIAKGIGVISRYIRLNLYYSFIYPYLYYLSYCNIAWASNCTSRLKRLSVLQRQAVRIVAGRSSTSHTTPCLKINCTNCLSELREMSVSFNNFGR